jgi:hypothetical protein
MGQVLHAFANHFVAHDAHTGCWQGASTSSVGPKHTQHSMRNFGLY